MFCNSRVLLYNTKQSFKATKITQAIDLVKPRVKHEIMKRAVMLYTWRNHGKDSVLTQHRKHFLLPFSRWTSTHRSDPFKFDYHEGSLNFFINSEDLISYLISCKIFITRWFLKIGGLAMFMEFEDFSIIVIEIKFKIFVEF